MTEKIIHVNGIGDIKLKKNKRSKAVSITIRPHKGIIVNMPYYLPFSEALKIIEMRRDWINKNLPRVRQIENKKTIFTEISEFKTRSRVLNILSHPGEKFTAQLTNDQIILNYPASAVITNPQIQELIRKAIQWALKAEAKEYLPSRIQYFSKLLDLKYN